MPVSSVASTDAVTTNRDVSIGKIADELKTENVGAAVVTEDEAPVGVVTDRDIVLALTETDGVLSQTAEDVMTGDPVTLRADEEGIEISRAIGERGVRRIPVVDEDGRLTGIVTLDDLVATIGEQLDNVAATIEERSSGYSP